MKTLDLKRPALKRCLLISRTMATMAEELADLIAAELPESAWPDPKDRERLKVAYAMRAHFGKLWREVE